MVTLSGFVAQMAWEGSVRQAARHKQAQGRGVHLNTLVSELKRHGFVCKRSRHSLKKSAIP
jgi:hypothetical protein